MQTNPRALARAAGLLLLLTILGGIYAQGLVANRLISYTDAALTAKNLMANRSLVQMSFSVFLIEMACQIAAIALFYRLLSPVNRTIALVSAVMNLAGSIMKTMARLFYIAPLFVLSGTPTLDAFNPDQLHALALLLLRINDRGAAMALGFLGVSGILNAYLIYRSGFLPRALGILGMIAAAGWLRYFFPQLRYPSFMIIVGLALLSAAVQIFWLCVYGVDAEKWRELRQRSE